jgi:NAD(P)-dependent dehydrogenase (short-subunit alcohol dehydrogenase family)
VSSPAPEAKTVLITGCSSGIGLDCAYQLQKMGFRVVASARKHMDVARLRAYGLQAVCIDTSDLDSINAGLDQALAYAGGSFYAVFHNAGYGQSGALEDLPSQALMEQFMANVVGAHQINLRLIPLMRKAGQGRIIFNSSVLGFVAMRYRGAYTASKFALEAMADTLRLELKGSGIQVSLLQPGPISTNFRRNSRNAFARHINAAQSVHADDYGKFLARLEMEGDTSKFTLPPGACTSALVDCLNSPKPRSRYAITRPTKVMAVLKRVLPVSVLDKIIFKAI